MISSLCHLLRILLPCIKRLTKGEIRKLYWTVFKKYCLYYSALQITPSANDSEYAKIHIPLALMRYRDFLEAQQVRQTLLFLLLLNLVLLPPFFFFFIGQFDEEGQSRMQSCSFKCLMSVCVSSGVWWRDAGEALRSTSLEDRRKHRSHASDCHRHSRLGRLLERGMWEVRYRAGYVHFNTNKLEQILEDEHVVLTCFC